MTYDIDWDYPDQTARDPNRRASEQTPSLWFFDNQLPRGDATELPADDGWRQWDLAVRAGRRQMKRMTDREWMEHMTLQMDRLLVVIAAVLLWILWVTT